MPTETVKAVPVAWDDPRAAALAAIERRHGAGIERSAVAGVLEVLASFRRPDGLWWMRAKRGKASDVVEMFVVPSAPYTSLKPGARVTLVKVQCGGCCFYEASWID